MDVFNTKQVCYFMKISPSTVSRRVAESRKGNSTFPLPIHGSHKKRLWRAEDIISWSEEESTVHHESPTDQERRLKAVHEELLKEFGIKVGDKTTD